jgi:hypothetical protein
MADIVELKFRSNVIPDYYLDPETGDIYSGKRNLSYYKRLSLTVCSSTGYMKITITSPGIPKSQHLHRLVAETLVPFPCPEGITKADWKATPESVKNLLCSQFRVNHIDHDRTNYHPTNLEWVTAKGNAAAYVNHRANIQ